MALSNNEKAPAEAAYERLRFSRKGSGAMAGVFIALFAGNSHWVVQLMRDPGVSLHEKIIVAVLLGAVFGAFVCSGIFLRRLSRRDKELVRFFEERFPDDCSWKQEEKILAEAEEIRLKAQADLAIRKATQS